MMDYSDLIWRAEKELKEKPIIGELINAVRELAEEQEAAEEDMESILARVEEIRNTAPEPLDRETDDAMGRLCIQFCARSGFMCFEEKDEYGCRNFCWRGKKGKEK